MVEGTRGCLSWKRAGDGEGVINYCQILEGVLLSLFSKKVIIFKTRISVS